MNISKEQIVEKLKKVKDPELKLDIIFLGLVRDINLENNKVIVTMTLTTPACPYAGDLLAQVKSAILELSGEIDVSVNLSLSPPWEPPTHVKELFGWD